MRLSVEMADLRCVRALAGVRPYMLSDRRIRLEKFDVKFIYQLVAFDSFVAW